jgi:nucleoside-diphosphate-sugar epimerase
MSRVCVVLGACGFLGSHLVEKLLAEGDYVVGFDDLSSGSIHNLDEVSENPNLEIHVQNINDSFEVNSRVDVVFNAASLASPKAYLADPIHTLITGSKGSTNAIELALSNSARYIYFSTSEVYGDPLEHPQRENYWGNVNPIGIRSCYDEAKRFGEALTMAYVREASLNAGIIRIFNTYGPRLKSDDGRVISNLIMQGLQREPYTVFGNGLQTRSFCYVSDLISAVQAFSHLTKNGPLNIGNPVEVTIRELVQIICDIIGEREDIRFLDLPEDDPARRLPDISQAKDLLDWEPRVSLVEGLEMTIDWFRRTMCL